jgi:hypothetical protein
MFVVHDFTYEPLDFQKNMFAFHDFKKDLEFRNNPPENPTIYEFYVWASNILGKNCNP